MSMGNYEMGSTVIISSKDILTGDAIFNDCFGILVNLRPLC